MKTRAFNHLLIDYKNGSITKTSSNVSKLRDEINYYLNLPKKISRFFPELIGYEKNFKSYTIEYLPYKSLAELIIANKISVEEAKTVLRKLFEMLDEIHYFKPLSGNNLLDIQSFYIKKTLNRLEQLKTNHYFCQLMQMPYIKINNKKYKNFYILEQNFIQSIKKFISQMPAITAIHGDFCFSNILYCPESKDIKLIDPRGSFGAEGIYGHPYYDYAKLLHCLNGKYDYIVNGNFKLEELDEHSFLVNILSSELINGLHQYYQKLLCERGINLKFLYLIESTLFLSMASLHYEDLQRQKLFFLTGLTKLNAICEGQYENLH